MEIDKLFPKVPYDLLTRIIPGGLAVLLLPAAFGGSLAGTMEYFLGEDVTPTTETTLTLVVLFGGAYLIGTVTSDLAGWSEQILLRRGLIPHHLYRLSPNAQRWGGPVDGLLDAFPLSADLADVARTLPDLQGLSDGRAADSIALKWYAILLEDADESDQTTLRDMRARYRMLDAVVMVALLAVVGTLISWNTSLLLPVFVGAVLTILAALRQRLIFQRDLIRRYVKSVQKTLDPATTPEPEDTIPSSFSQGDTERVVVVGTDTDLKHLNSLCPNPPSGTGQTPFGPAYWYEFDISGRKLVFLRRYPPGEHRRWEPHTYIWWAAKHGVKSIISIHGVGAITNGLEKGDVVVPVDFLDLTCGAHQSFSERLGIEVFARMNPAFCPRWTGSITKMLDERFQQGRPVKCACTRGPRIETVWEVEALASLGADVVGMRHATEAILAREAGLCFSSVSIVLNRAESADQQGGAAVLSKLTQDLPRQVVNERMAAVFARIAAGDLPTGDCSCNTALTELQRRGFIQNAITEIDIKA